MKHLGSLLPEQVRNIETQCNNDSTIIRHLDGILQKRKLKRREPVGSHRHRIEVSGFSDAEEQSCDKKENVAQASQTCFSTTPHSHPFNTPSSVLNGDNFSQVYYSYVVISVNCR